MYKFNKNKKTNTVKIKGRGPSLIIRSMKRSVHYSKTSLFYFSHQKAHVWNMFEEASPSGAKLFVLTLCPGLEIFHSICHGRRSCGTSLLWPFLHYSSHGFILKSELPFPPVCQLMFPFLKWSKWICWHACEPPPLWLWVRVYPPINDETL